MSSRRAAVTYTKTSQPLIVVIKLRDIESYTAGHVLGITCHRQTTIHTVRIFLVLRIIEVTLRRARLLLGWVTVFGRLGMKPAT